MVFFTDDLGDAVGLLGFKGPRRADDVPMPEPEGLQAGEKYVRPRHYCRVYLAQAGTEGIVQGSPALPDARRAQRLSRLFGL